MEVAFNDLMTAGVRLMESGGPKSDVDDINRAFKIFSAAYQSAQTLEEAVSALGAMASALRGRFEITGDHEAIELAIVLLKSMIEPLADGGMRSPGLYNNLGNTYLTKHGRSGDLGDLRLALENLDLAVDLSDPDDPGLSTRLRNQGDALTELYVVTAAGEVLTMLETNLAQRRSAGFIGEQEQVHRRNQALVRHHQSGTSAENLTRLVESACTALRTDLPEELADWFSESLNAAMIDILPNADPELGAAVGRSLVRHHRDAPGLGRDRLLLAASLWCMNYAQIAPSASALRELLPIVGAEVRQSRPPARLEEMVLALVFACWHCHKADESAQLLDLSIELADLIEGGTSVLAQRGWGVSGFFLLKRYWLSQSVADLSMAIERLTFLEALGIPMDGEERMELHIALARAHHERGAMLHNADELSAVIDRLRPSAVSSHEAADWMGMAYFTRSELTSSVSDLDEALHHTETAIRLAPPGYHRAAAITFNLGNGYRTRFDRHGRREDLDAAISWIGKALDITDPQSNDYPIHLNGNALARKELFQLTGDAAELTESGRLLHEALSHARDESLRAGIMANIGGIHMTRAQELGDAASVDKAVTWFEQALRQTPPEHPNRNSYHHNLASVLLGRFQARRSTEDQASAISHLRHALMITGETHELRPRTLNMLGLALYFAGRHAEAIDLIEESIRSTPQGGADIVGRQVHLAQILLRDGKPESVQRAIDILTAMAPGRHTVTTRLPLANAYRTRFRQSRDVADIALAVSTLDEYIDGLPQGHWDSISARETAAEMAVECFRETMEPQLLERANAHARVAAELGRHAPYDPASGSALMTYATLLALGSPDEEGDVATAIEVGLEGLASYLWAVLREDDPLARLRLVAEINSAAGKVQGWALARDDTSNLIKAIEAGRALTLFAHSVTATVPELLRRADAGDLAQEWESAEVASRFEPSGQARPVDTAAVIPAALRYRAFQALSSSSSELSDVFVHPPSVPQIAGALGELGHDALLYLRLGASGTGAVPGFAVFVTTSGEVGSQRLDQLHLDDAPDHPLRDHLAGRPGATVRLAEWAWETAFREMIPRVRAAAKLPDGQVLRLCVVPTGALGLVPWHAARRAEGGRFRYLLEEAIVSYAVSARGLILSGRQPSMPADGRALLLSDPTGTLAGAEQEVGAIAAEIYPQATVTSSADEAAAAILRAMPSSDDRGLPVIHLACHGELASPSWASRLAMGEGKRLTVGRILEHSRGRPPNSPGPVVVLGACDTNVAIHAMDEMLTLSTAFQICGAATVIGSLWAVNDVSAAACLYLFHRYLSQGHGPAEALRSAQLWMIDPHRRLPDPATLSADAAALLSRALLNELIVDGMQLSDPYHWAAFTHQGR